MARSERSNQDFTWYACVNDLIGGWCVHTADLSCAELRYMERDDHRCIASFTSEEDARYIARLHNEYRALSQLRPV